MLQEVVMPCAYKKWKELIYTARKLAHAVD